MAALSVGREVIGLLNDVCVCVCVCASESLCVCASVCECVVGDCVRVC